MGLVSKVTALFRKPAADPKRRQSVPSGGPHESDVALMEAYEDDSASGGRPSSGALVEVRPMSIASGASSRRNKQELLDDLEKSYREVVELVRKVDGHLDKADQRADRMADIADRLLDAVEKLPNSTSEHDERRHREQIQHLDAVAVEQRAGVDRLDTTLARLGVQAEVAGQSHEQLVMTMAEFRETMCDVARTTTRSASALESGNEQKRESDERLTRVIVGNQRWMLGILAASMTLAAAALIVAVVAMFKLSG